MDVTPRLLPNKSKVDRRTIIECKRSDSPYVFFLSEHKPFLLDFPLCVGLSKDQVNITTDDDASSWSFSVPSALELHARPFAREDPEYSMSFTKCVRKGSDMELTGDDSFHSLILPIAKAMRHFKRTETPTKTAFYFDCHLTLGIGILDVTMLGVRVSEKTNELVFVPWVRLVRHETIESRNWWEREKLIAIDIVHKDFFAQYIDRHLLPFAEEFSKLVIKHQEVLASGQGSASGMGRNSWHDISQRLQPRKVDARVSRSKIVLKNILKLLAGRVSK